MSGVKGKSGAPGKKRRPGGGRKRSRIIFHVENRVMVQRIDQAGEELGNSLVATVATISGDSRRNDTVVLVGQDETITISVLPKSKRKKKEKA